MSRTGILQTGPPAALSRPISLRFLPREHSSISRIVSLIRGVEKNFVSVTFPPKVNLYCAGVTGQQFSSLPSAKHLGVSATFALVLYRLFGWK